MKAKPGEASREMEEVNGGNLPLAWNTILVPTDLSEASKFVLKTAAALAQKCGAKLVLLHVVQMPNCCSFDAPPDADEMIELARKSLDRFAQIIAQNVAVKKIVRFGPRDPVEEIVEEANNTSADVIVIATHGYCGLKRALRGSTAERVVRHSPCPVLVLRMPGVDPQQSCALTGEQPNPFKGN